MYSHILVAIDLDEPRSWAWSLPMAADLACFFSAHLTLCSIVRDRDAEGRAERSTIGMRALADHVRTRLQVIASAVEKPVPDVETGFGSVCGGVLGIAERVGADLIVLASHPPGVKDYLLAANAARIARRAACSVLVVRDGGRDSRKPERPAAMATA